MTSQNAPAVSSPATSTATLASQVSSPAPPSWPWRRGALLLSGAAQPSLQARLVAVTLADQAGRAFGSSQTARAAR